MIRNWIGKVFNMQDPIVVEGLESKVAVLETEIIHLKDQSDVDQTECRYLKEKLFRIRELIGDGDECFSKYTRKQITNMSLKDWNEAESEIDQDLANGKIFLK